MHGLPHDERQKLNDDVQFTMNCYNYKFHCEICICTVAVYNGHYCV